MSEKKTKTLIYKGLGFPIKLIDVPMKKMFGDWVMDIDMTELQIVVFKALAHKSVALTKEEFKFMRHFLNFATDGEFHIVQQLFGLMRQNLEE